MDLERVRGSFTNSEGSQPRATLGGAKHCHSTSHVHGIIDILFRAPFKVLVCFI
jgi:hypothetical protein